jgi:hypothetical protein
VTPPRCSATAASGHPCKAAALPDRDVCRWHDDTPEGRERQREAGRKGGKARTIPAIGALAEDPALAALDPSTTEGLRDCVSATIRALFRLPFDVRVANCLGGLATAQRALIESSELERRLAALEAAQPDNPHTPPHLRAV